MDARRLIVPNVDDSAKGAADLCPAHAWDLLERITGEFLHNVLVRRKFWRMALGRE